MHSHTASPAIDCDLAEQAFRDAVHGLFRALREGDAEAAATLFAADASRTVYALCSGAPHAGQYVGRDAIAAQLRKICAQWQTLEHRFDALNVDGDRAFARIRVRAVDHAAGTFLEIDETNVFQNSLAGFARLETFVEAVRIEKAADTLDPGTRSTLRPFGDHAQPQMIDPA